MRENGVKRGKVTKEMYNMLHRSADTQRNIISEPIYINLQQNRDPLNNSCLTYGQPEKNSLTERQKADFQVDCVVLLSSRCLRCLLAALSVKSQEKRGATS